MAKKKVKETDVNYNVDEETGEVIERNDVEISDSELEVDPREVLRKKFLKIGDYREKANIRPVEYKPQEWINMSDAFKEVTKLPGIPIGHFITCMGKSDTGKSTMLIEAGAHALKQGILPILIITENKFSWERAEMMGLYEEFCIVHKGVKTIEEGWERVREHLDDLETGKLQKQMNISSVIFLFDSIGGTPSKAELETSNENFEVLKDARHLELDGGTSKKETKVGGMMVTAKVLREKFTRDLCPAMNRTREVSCPYDATFLAINHCYSTLPVFPAKVGSLALYGGDALYLGSTLIFRMGGVSSRSSVVTAQKDGVEVGFAIKSALVVEKNHITDVRASGKIICSNHGFILDDKTTLDAYKAKYKKGWNLNFDKYWDNVSKE